MAFFEDTTKRSKDIFFLYGFSFKPFKNHRTTGEGGGYFCKVTVCEVYGHDREKFSSLTLQPASHTRRH